MENDIIAIVMAAGKGTRMKSKNSKLVQKIYGKEIVKRAVENAEKAGENQMYSGKKGRCPYKVAWSGCGACFAGYVAIYRSKSCLFGI